MKVVLGHPNNMLLGDVYWEYAGDALLVYFKLQCGKCLAGPVQHQLMH